MKALSPESPRPRTVKRISKPVMEKRRRERINQSLETLRLLMLESTNNVHLKNPKVEKAEILESVVQFLKSGNESEKGQQPVKRVLSREQRPSSAHQQSYHDGMRSCLLRVGHFIARKSQELGEAGGAAVKASLTHPEPQTHPSSPAALSPQHLLHHHGISHPYLTQMTGLCDTREPFSPTAAPTHITDPVWRPWLQ